MIKRSPKSRNYTCIDNLVFTSGLSLQAMGLLSWFLSKPDNWEVSIAGAETQLKESKNTINKYLNELERAGFCTKHRQNTGKVDWILSDMPHPKDWDKEKKPHPKKPHPKVCAQVSNNNKQVIKNTCASPQKAERFGDWWMQYPVKKGKQKAMEIWSKQCLDEKADELISSLIQQNSKDAQWKRGIGIPHPTTYLNQQRWTDEPTPEQNNETRNATPGQTRNDLHRDFYEKVATTGELGSCDFREDANTLRKYVDETNRVNRAGSIEGSGGVVNAVGLFEG